MVGIPFEIVASTLAVRALFRLLAMARTNQTPAAQVSLIVGILLAIVSVGPLIIIAARVL